MSLSIDEIRVSNRWASETDPSTWDKSSILDDVQIEVDVSSTGGTLVGAEFMMNVALFRDAGTPWTGNTRPGRGFYGILPAALSTVTLTPTGIPTANKNWNIFEVEMLTTTSFTIRFGFRMLADRGDFFSTVTMDSINQLLKNHIAATNTLENVEQSVYNTTKELQMYIYTNDGTDEETVMARQNFAAKWYGDDAAFAWDGNDFCALNTFTAFPFSFTPAQSDPVDDEFFAMVFEASGQNTTDYDSDLDFEESSESNIDANGGTYNLTLTDYAGRYYTAIVYNVDGVSYAAIEERLESSCLPKQLPVGLYGHIADYLGGDSSLSEPCINNLDKTEQNTGWGVNTWWRPLRNITFPIGFDGDLTEVYPGGGTAYSSGAFPVDGNIYEMYSGGAIGNWTARSSPALISEFQHDADAATTAANFATMINTYYFTQWEATIDDDDARIVHMRRVNVNGYLSNLYGLGYQFGAGGIQTQTPSIVGSDASSLIIDEYMSEPGVQTTLTITWDDVPYDDDLTALVDYINTQTIYYATEDADFYVCMPPGLYATADIAASSVEIITRTNPAHAEEKELFGGAAAEHEDYTEQVVSERLEATAKLDKSVYDDLAALSDYFNDIETDLKRIKFTIGGETFTATRSGNTWAVNNSKLVITEDDDELVAVYKFRGQFENNQGITDWSGTTQTFKWEFEFEYSTPTVYKRVAEYYQKATFATFDVGGGNFGEVFSGHSLSKDGGGVVNSLCDLEEVDVEVQSNNFLEDPDVFDLVVLIDADPYGSTIKNENAVEEEDDWVSPGQLAQLSTDKLTVTQKDFTATIAEFTVHVDELQNRKYKLYALAYGEMPPPPPLLGEDYNDFHMYWGMAQYTEAQITPIFRAWRSSDFAEKDFYGDSDFRLSLTSEDGSSITLASWLGSDDGFVATWYEPINSNDVEQATAANMPQFADAGALITINGRVAFDFLEGTDTWLAATALSGGTVTQPFTAFIACKAPVYISSGTMLLFAAGGSSQKGWLLLNNDDIRTRFGSVFNQDVGWLNEASHIIYGLIDGASSEVGIDGDAEFTGDAGSNDFDNEPYIGITGALSQSFRGYMSEIALADHDKSAQRAGVVTNINDRIKYY